MKTHSYLAAAALLGPGLAVPFMSSSSLHAQSAASAETAQPAQGGGGVLAREDGLYWVFDGKAGKLDATTVPPGQIMLPNGRLQALPSGVAGLPGGSGSAAEISGLTVVNDQVYLVAKGQATRVDPAAIPAGHMLTWDGKISTAPFGLSYVGKVTPGTVTPGTVTPGTVTPGKVTPGSISVDGSVRGGDVKGGDVKGGDVKGGDVKGGDVKGGDVKGGDVKGGDVKGGDVKGGDVRGGDVPKPGDS